MNPSLNLSGNTFGRANPVVMDTNVLVSACFGGHAAHAIASWLGGQLQLVVSSEILDEYLYTLERFPLATSERLSLWSSAFSDTHRTICVTPEFTPQLCKDPADNKFLAAALSGHATHLLTSDKLLLCLKQIESTLIWPAKRFVEAGHAPLPPSVEPS